MYILMDNLITKEFAEKESPNISEEWHKKSHQERIDLINTFIKKIDNVSFFDVVSAYDNGHVILKTDKQIEANKRGMLLLDLEKKIKNEIDMGLTLWLEPVGDKSKLRALRGIEIK